MSISVTVLDWLSVVFANLGVLILAALGLAIIFGMMGIINLAHGEFIMVGAYATAVSYHSLSAPLPLAILVGGVATGVLGLVLERLIIRHLYDRLIDSMVATWGISLILVQATLLTFGSRYPGVPTPFGPLRIGGFTTSTYKVVVTLSALVLLGVVYFVFQYTDFGMKARATMQNDDMARSLGVDTDYIYMGTFFLGSFITGIAGGLFAPTVSIVPSLGSSFIIEAFVTVIVGGTNVLVGTFASALSLSTIRSLGAQTFGTLAGRVALLLTAIVIIRLLPQGISTYLEEHS